MHRITSSRRFTPVPSALGLLAVLAVGWLAGCGGDARLELASADAMEVIADQQQVTIDEYHADILALDDDRETAVVDAFVVRVQRDAVADPSALDGHAAAFRQALAKIRADREVEYARHRGAADNAEALREVADGLRETAVESLTFQDELRRYISSLIEARRKAEQESRYAQ